jgi:hypothetical protein
MESLIWHIPDKRPTGAARVGNYDGELRQFGEFAKESVGCVNAAHFTPAVFESQPNPFAMSSAKGTIPKLKTRCSRKFSIFFEMRMKLARSRFAFSRGTESVFSVALNSIKDRRKKMGFGCPTKVK